MVLSDLTNFGLKGLKYYVWEKYFIFTAISMYTSVFTCNENGLKCCSILVSNLLRPQFVTDFFIKEKSK